MGRWMAGWMDELGIRSRWSSPGFCNSISVMCDDFQLFDLLLLSYSPYFPLPFELKGLKDSFSLGVTQLACHSKAGPRGNSTGGTVSDMADA